MNHTDTTETWWTVYVVTDTDRFEDEVLAYDAEDAHASAKDCWPRAEITVLDD